MAIQNLTDEKIALDIRDMAHDETFFNSIRNTITRDLIYMIGRGDVNLADTGASPLQLMHIGAELMRWQTYKAERRANKENQAPASDPTNEQAIERIHSMFPEGFTGEQVLSAVSSGLEMYAGFIEDNSEIPAENLAELITQTKSIAASIQNFADRMAAIEIRAFPPVFPKAFFIGEELERLRVRVMDLQHIAPPELRNEIINIAAGICDISEAIE